MTTIELPITGMTCASCVARNEKVLRKLPGVDEASVNFATEKATVTFDPGAVTATQIVQAVEAAGYGVVTQTETLPILGMTTPIQFDGQLLLCAVEVQYIGTDRPLTLEFESSHPAIAQHKPQQRLGVSLIAP